MDMASADKVMAELFNFHMHVMSMALATTGMKLALKVAAVKTQFFKL